MTVIKNGQKIEFPTWFTWLTGGFAAALISIGVWVGSIQTAVQTNTEYRRIQAPILIETSAGIREVSATVKGMSSKLDAIQTDIRENRAAIQQKQE